MPVTVDLTAISAEIILVATGIVILLVDLFVVGKKKTWLAVLALVGILLAGWAAYIQYDYAGGRIFYQEYLTFAEGEGGVTQPVTQVRQNFEATKFAMGVDGDGSIVVDNLAIVFKCIFLLGAVLTVLLSVGYLNREEGPKGEYYALLLFCTVGMMVMASATDLLTLFVGLETLSIPIYVLAGFQRDRIRSNEAGLKYLLMGAFASGFFIYGISYIYGATGTVRLHFIAEALAGTKSPAGEPYLLIGLALLFVGFAFKIAAVPFHMWTPDVYEGAPTVITAFMSVAVKAAAFAGLLRVVLILVPFADLVEALKGGIWWIAVLTMTVGNLLALVQKNIKRMLAFSSISHAGYLLVGILAAIQMDTLNMALAGILYYLIAYTLMNIGAFAIVLLVARKGDKFENIEDFAGLGGRHPVLAAGMVLFMLSLAGIPPTAGFFGKFYVFGAAVAAGMIPLVVIAVINSLISVFYYLRPVIAMYFEPSPEDEEERGPIEIPYAAEFTLYFTATAVLLIGVIPNRLMPLVNAIIAGP
jgi:NADH-quinone oxidoreductase subunit N